MKEKMNITIEDVKTFRDNQEQIRDSLLMNVQSIEERHQIYTIHNKIMELLRSLGRCIYQQDKAMSLLKVIEEQIYMEKDIAPIPDSTIHEV